jgi:hypothetical protein
MTRPAEYFSSNQGGVGLDSSQLSESAAWKFLLHGDRQQRRAAKRWLNRQKRELVQPLQGKRQEIRDET